MTVRSCTKGQIEFNETILVIFFIVIIIAIGMFFYYRYFMQDVADVAEEFGEQESSVMLASIAALAEIQCSEGDCIDTSKLVPFSQIVKANSVFYARELGQKRIVVRKTYPEPATPGVACDARTYSQRDYPGNCGFYALYEQRPAAVKLKTTVSTPVSLYYPETDEYHIGRLEIERYA